MSEVSPLGVIRSIVIADLDLVTPLSAGDTLSEVKGTLKYMSPEKIRLNANAPGVDMYALGIIALELLDEDEEFFHRFNKMEAMARCFQIGMRYEEIFFIPYKDKLELRIQMEESLSVKSVPKSDTAARLKFIQTYVLPLLDPFPAKRSTAIRALIEKFGGK